MVMVAAGMTAEGICRDLPDQEPALRCLPGARLAAMWGTAVADSGRVSWLGAKCLP